MPIRVGMKRKILRQLSRGIFVTRLSTSMTIRKTPCRMTMPMKMNKKKLGNERAARHIPFHRKKYSQWIP